VVLIKIKVSLHDEIVNRRFRLNILVCLIFIEEGPADMKRFLKATLCVNRMDVRVCVVSQARKFLIKLYYVEWRRRSRRMTSIEHGEFSFTFSLISFVSLVAIKVPNETKDKRLVKKVFARRETTMNT
jgi:hypothetical protein